MLEKKSWKNWIKPVILSIVEIVAIISLVKIGLFICDYDSGKYAFLEVPIFIALFFIIEEYLRCCAEMSARKKSSKVKIEINKSYFNEIMNYISDSNVISSRIKESLKEDILSTYSKRGEHDLPYEYFITSQENAAVFKAAYNEVKTVNKGYGDYGFIYEYENWKWQYGKGKK